MIRYTLFFSLAILLFACGDMQPEEAEKLTPEKQQMVIEKMEQELLGSKSLDQPINQNKAKNLIIQYQNYINMNPKDSLTSVYLFRAADMSIAVGSYEACIKYLDKIINDFPNSDRIVETMLFKGFVYETHIGNHANAIASYKALIDRYPNHRLAGDARAAIDNLTLTEEELLEKFEKMKKEQPLPGPSS
ncbi:MAG: hypothetical protein Salg2KO_12140 [Salibacteraceae bacterium]